MNSQPALVIAPDGRVVAYNELEARRARVSPWRAIGRDFYRDLAWTLSVDIVERVRRFQLIGGSDERFTAAIAARGGSQDVEVRLAWLDGNVQIEIVPATSAAH